VNKKDQDNLAKLYLENYDVYDVYDDDNKDLPYSDEEIKKIYQTLSEIDTDKFPETLGYEAYDLYLSITKALDIIKPLLK